MSRNVLKIFACISMLIDHTGYILFPELNILRYIGRLAMPIFAFFIGEGCLHTKNTKKYFTRVFLLGIVCQSFYTGEALITGYGNPFYLNILLTFSCSILLCSALRKILEKKDKKQKFSASVLLGGLLLAFGIFTFVNKKGIIPIEFDYGLPGILLPVFATVTKNKKQKMLAFSSGLVLCVFLLNYPDVLWSICAFLSLIPLWFYNGKPGRKNLTLAFYLFYPLHLAVLYAISYLF